MPQVGTGRVKARDIELAYEATGEGGPFLWAHGMTSTRAGETRRGLFEWSAAVRDVARLIRYDARGHGASGWSAQPEDYTWENLGRDMVALADALGLERFVAGGASMGCATTLFAALQIPDRIERVVLAIPPTAWETRAARSSMYEAGAAFVETQGLAALAALEEQEPLPEIFARDFPEKREHDRAATLAMNVDAFPVLLRGAGLCDLPSRDALRGMAQPALILAWESDPVHPVSTAETLADVLPNASLHVAASMSEVRAWPAHVRDFLMGAAV